MARLLFFVFLLLLAGAAGAQAPNNDIENRLQLLPEVPLVSGTAGCTVQKACVDERLTGKCIQYHNDQWFYFTAGTADAYYLNIAGQQCRDQRGVQLVVLQGEPCRPETYQVLSCTSLSTQDDIFVKLHLQPHQTYLLNVDGYLHDDCTFTITLSTQPAGLPVTLPLQPVAHQTLAKGLVHTTTWRMPETDLADSLAHFELWRRKNDGFRAQLIGRLPVTANAFGHGDSYTLTDTVPEKGTYVYQLFGVKPGGEKVPLLRLEEELGKPDYRRYAAVLPLEFRYRKKTPLDIVIYDAATNALLYKYHFVAGKKLQVFNADVTSAVQQGITHFRITAHNLNDNTRKEWLQKL